MTNYVKRTGKLLQAGAWATHSISFFITTAHVKKAAKVLSAENVVEHLENTQTALNARAKHKYRRATLGREATAELEAQEQQIQPGMGG